MKITDVKTRVFRYRSSVGADSHGHTHPADEHDAHQTVVTIETDEGVSGHAFGGDADIIRELVRPELLGKDPLMRERLWQELVQWQRIQGGRLSDRILGVVDQALWDLAGTHVGLPVYKLLGGFRDRVPAYASTMCGDEVPGGLATPEDYATFAERCMSEGYPAFKLHTWMPPISWAPDPKMDVKACAAVREAVGPDVPLMLDAFHYYSREDAYYLGRELQKLDYFWFEEPMPEANTSSYVWLAEQLEIPIIGPETAEGKMFTRAEWIVRGASDITRAGVGDVGGITPTMKIVHLAEAHGLSMEVHGGQAANLHVLGAMGIPGRWYERGLLHPHDDYEARTPYLKKLIDPLNPDGTVSIPEGPGLGHEIDWDFIDSNIVD